MLWKLTASIQLVAFLAGVEQVTQAMEHSVKVFGVGFFRGDECSFRSFVILDIDECILMKDDCDQNAECSNTLGSFRCICNIGFIGSGRAGNCSESLTCFLGTVVVLYLGHGTVWYSSTKNVIF